MNVFDFIIKIGNITMWHDPQALRKYYIKKKIKNANMKIDW